MASAHPDPLVLDGDNLAYWFNASGLIRTMAENEGITAENLGEPGQKLILKYEEMRLPHGMADWQLFSDLLEGHSVFSLNSKEKHNAATVARRAASAASVSNILTREAIINNIDFDPSTGFTREQALAFLDYIGYKTPSTMLTGLFADFGSPDPVIGHIPAAARHRPAADPPGRLNHRYNNNNGDRHGNNNGFEYNNNVNQNEENYAARRRGNREFQMEQLGRHGAAAARYLNYNDNNNWNGARPGKGKRRGGKVTRKGKKTGRKTRRA